MTTTASRAVRVGERSIPVVLPKWRDPRLHTAAVIVSIHIIGITALGFEVSVFQILAAIVTAAVIDVAITLRRTGQLVWPASGMLTGSGVALILRYVPTGSGEYWSWAGWYWFALVGGASVLSKFVIRKGDGHLFNPSNLGLVVVFLLVGSNVLEPLDFWWAPLDIWMTLAYIIIIGGGVLITRRLHLLEMAATFWGVLVAGLGVLVFSGHCMIATWSVTPVCDGRFWSTLATSPEILIFLFFMITDPKTVPRGRAARVVFSVVLGVLATLLIAPNTLEYGAKIGLLASLVVLSPFRGVFDRVFSMETDGSGLRGVISRLTRGGSTAGVFARGAALGSSLVLIAALIFIAGTPAREPAAQPTPDDPVAIEVDIDPETIPGVEVDPSVDRLDIEITDNVAQELAIVLAESLQLEGEAMRNVDTEPLLSADGGKRLIEMQARIDDAIADGRRPVDTYSFETLLLRSAGESEGQTSAALAFDATGTIEEAVHSADGEILSTVAEPFSLTFILRRPTGDRWLIVDVLDLPRS